MKRIFLLFTLCVICTNISLAQQLDINGLIINEHYTDEEILSRINTPSKIHRYKNEFGNNARYIFNYGSGQTDYEYVGIHGENGINEFMIALPNNFSLFNGQIKVGDNISKFNQLGNGTLKRDTSRSDAYYYHVDKLYDPIHIIVDSNNNIRALFYTERL